MRAAKQFDERDPIGPGRAFAPASMEVLEPRLLLSTWTLEGHIGGADWVTGLGADWATGSGLAIAGSYQSGNWQIQGGVSATGGGPAAPGAPAAPAAPGDPDASATDAVTESVEWNNWAAVSPLFVGRPARPVEPDPNAVVQQGQHYRIQWTGGEDADKVGVLRLGPDGWQVAVDDAPPANGGADWDTSGEAPGLYLFATRTCVGDQWLTLQTPGWVRLNAPDADGPALMLTLPAGSVVLADSQGQLELTWEARLPEGLPATLEIRAHNEQDGWVEIGADVDPGTGRFWWDVHDVSAGTWTILATLEIGDLSFSVSGEIVLELV